MTKSGAIEGGDVSEMRACEIRAVSEGRPGKVCEAVEMRGPEMRRVSKSRIAEIHTTTKIELAKIERLRRKVVGSKIGDRQFPSLTPRIPDMMASSGQCKEAFCGRIFWSAEVFACTGENSIDRECRILGNCRGANFRLLPDFFGGRGTERRPAGTP